MEKITYVGGSDVIRTGKGFSWREFQGDGKELIIDKQYNVTNQEFRRKLVQVQPSLSITYNDTQIYLVLRFNI